MDEKQEETIDKQEETIDKNQVSITGAIFASMIVSFIVFALMMWLIVVPMLEKTEAKVDAINFNDSQFVKIKNEFNQTKEQVDAINIMQKKNTIYLDEIKSNIGRWKCIKYKIYDDLDCKIATKNKEAFMIDNKQCYYNSIIYTESEKNVIGLNLITTMPEICEEWEYVKV